MASFIEGIMRHGKRGAAYVGVGIFQTITAYLIALHHPEALTGYAAVIGAIDLNLYGGGALAKWAEARCIPPVPPVPPGPLPASEVK
jgi:hypothetical protein